MMDRDGTFGNAGLDALASGAGRVAEVAGATAALARHVVDHARTLVEDVADDSAEVAREVESVVALAREQVAGARDWVRAAPRLSRVTVEVLGVAARYRVQGAIRAARTELTWDEPTARRALDRLHHEQARRARLVCEELRGGVLKVGQFAATRMDLLPDAWVEELSHLHDRVPPLPAGTVSKRLEAELGPDWGRHFASFEPAPMAAASLAQVHGATLADGTSVAVKLLVPGIEEVVETDLTALRILLPVLRDALPRMDLGTVGRELARGVRRELDLVAEAATAVEMARAFAGDPDVLVPAIYPEATTRGVLVMERVHGERLLDFLNACEARGGAGARDRDRVLEILIRSFCQQVLRHGIFQADPHPGNFLVVPGPAGPRLALLDFGCVERYEAPLRLAYARLAAAVLAGDEAAIQALFAEMGFHSRTGDPDSLRAYADMMLEVFRQDGIFDADAADPHAAIERVLALTRANPIVEIPGHFVMLGRVFASLGGLLLRFRPRIRLAALLTPHLPAN